MLDLLQAQRIDSERATMEPDDRTDPKRPGFAIHDQVIFSPRWALSEWPRPPRTVIEEFDEELAGFRKRHPDYRIPEALLAPR